MSGNKWYIQGSHYLVGLLLLLIWFIFISPVYIEKPLEIIEPIKIENLSQTLIQTNGILVSFIAISGFYFLGKRSNLFRKIQLFSNNTINQCQKGRRISEKLENKIIEAYSDLLKMCKDCNKRQTCTTLSNHSKLLNEKSEKAKQYKDAFTEQYTSIEKIIEFDTKYDFTNENFMLIPLLITTIFFFISIILSITAYITLDPDALSTGISTIVYGIIWTMITWIASNQNLRDLKKTISSIVDINRSIRRRKDLVFSLKDTVETRIHTFQDCEK